MLYEKPPNEGTSMWVVQKPRTLRTRTLGLGHGSASLRLLHEKTVHQSNRFSEEVGRSNNECDAKDGWNRFRVSTFDNIEELSRVSCCLPEYIRKGIAMATFILGRCFERGHGVKQDGHQAVALYKKVSRRICSSFKFKLPLPSVSITMPMFVNCSKIISPMKKFECVKGLVTKTKFDVMQTKITIVYLVFIEYVSDRRNKQ